MIERFLKDKYLLNGMSRTVLLPREYEVRLKTLTSLEQEVNGALLYRQQGNYCPIEANFMTAVGTAGHVRAEQERMDIANEFFRRNPEYRFVKYHTHSKGTIKRFGEHFAHNFSDGDIRSYEEQLGHDPDFIGMVVTPRAMLLYGRDNPQLRVVQGVPSEASRRIDDELAEIARAMGHDLDGFQATFRQS